MTPKKYSTSQIARAACCHPNTVRLYEAFGYLAEIPRSPIGYRLFNEYHIEQMKLARLALVWPYPGGKAIVEKLVRLAAVKDLDKALELSKEYLQHIRMELDYANNGVQVLEHWAQDQPEKPLTIPLTISEAAKSIGVTPDALRNWERNGLVTIPRNLNNRYRAYNEPILGLLKVIRLLRQSGYSIMAILRVVHHLDLGHTRNMAEVIDLAPGDEDAVTIADRWLSTLKGQEIRGLSIIEHIQCMIHKYSICS